jgi:type IX secretion system PorP/SprF family membrane protein
MRNLFFLCALLPLICVAQFNPLQTQYMQNPVVINPACAGEQGYMSATLSARRQWLGFDGAPETFVFTLHTPVKSLHHNMGVLVAQDNIAVIHKTQLQLVYAYRINARKVSFSAGLAPGISLYKSAWGEVATTTEGDAAFAGTERSTRFEIGYGLYLNSKRFFIGASSQVVITDVATTVDQPFQLYAGVRFGNAEKAQVTISSLGRVMLNSYMQADVNVNILLRNRLGFGVSYRHQDALCAMINIKLNDQFSLGYSYDYTISDLKNYSDGSHEIMLRYDFGYTVDRPNPRSF